jgi:hypothetical protein
MSAEGIREPLDVESEPLGMGDQVEPARIEVAQRSSSTSTPSPTVTPVSHHPLFEETL